MSHLPCVQTSIFIDRLTLEFPSIDRTGPFLSEMLQTGPFKPIQHQENECCGGDDDHPISDFEQPREGQVARIAFHQNALIESRVESGRNAGADQNPRQPSDDGVQRTSVKSLTRLPSIAYSVSQCFLTSLKLVKNLEPCGLTQTRHSRMYPAAL
jgi:hypothetical protein